MARYASFCLTMGPFKGEVHVLPDYGPLELGLVLRLGQYGRPILATTGLLVWFKMGHFLFKHFAYRQKGGGHGPVPLP